MKFDLMMDPIHTIFAIDCQVTRDKLKVGAIYLDPMIQSAVVQLSSGAATLRVELPSQLLNRSVPTTGWDVEFPIIV